MDDIRMETDDSTLVRSGRSAVTMVDMEEYVESIVDRPLDKLLADLPGLAALSDLKFVLTRQVVRRRLRDLPDVEREQLRLFALEVAREAKPLVGERIHELFARPV